MFEEQVEGGHRTVNLGDVLLYIYFFYDFTFITTPSPNSLWRPKNLLLKSASLQTVFVSYAFLVNNLRAKL